MIAKLQEYMNGSRIPLLFRRRNGIVYFQSQIEIAREDGLCAGRYCEFDKISADAPLEEIGMIAKRMLARFHELSDLTIDEFKALTGCDDIEAFEDEQRQQICRFIGAKNGKELRLSYDECSVDYLVVKDHYAFVLDYVYQEGRKKWNDSSPSTGEKGVLTFSDPLEFDNDVAPERLGEMILEAFDRSRKMAEVKSSGVCPPKEIDLFEGTIVEVTPPKDKHFADYDDAGVGEIYQDYAYIAREGSESSADFLLTAAPEIYEDLSCDNIRSAWLEAFGKADELDVTETEYGIFRYRAEFRNKKMYRIAYFRELNDGTALECCLELTSPSKKKKLTEKLPEIFEKFALDCKIK